MTRATICYLCGKGLDGAIDDDHVPPQQLYSHEIRRSVNLSRLLTLPTHEICNRSYSLDEEYFTHVFGPIANRSLSGESIWREIAQKYLSGEKTSLLTRSLHEIHVRPSGLYLPSDIAIRRFNPQRVWRVIWKIIRGLYFYHHSEILPEDTPRGFDLVSPGYPPPPAFEVVRNQPSMGSYPTVFDYKYIKVDDPKDFHLWAMLFWDEIIMLVYFHDPQCACDQCAKMKSPPVS